MCDQCCETGYETVDICPNCLGEDMIGGYNCPNCSLDEGPYNIPCRICNYDSAYDDIYRLT